MTLRTLSTVLALSLSISACTTNLYGMKPTTPEVAKPVPLVGSEWRVEDVLGRGVIDSSNITLNFSKDGRVSGSASCNRYNSQYTVTGNHIKMSSAASTRMACAPALMTQEQVFLKALENVRTFDFDSTSALLLISPDGSVIKARRD